LSHQPIIIQTLGRKLTKGKKFKKSREKVMKSCTIMSGKKNYKSITMSTEIYEYKFSLNFPHRHHSVYISSCFVLKFETTKHQTRTSKTTKCQCCLVIGLRSLSHTGECVLCKHVHMPEMRRVLFILRHRRRQKKIFMVLEKKFTYHHKNSLVELHTKNE